MWLPFNPEKDALFLDIDGTLLDIAPSARDVTVPPALVRNLERLDHKLEGALALVSGRMIHEIDGLFAPLRLRCAGAHGAEWRLSPHGPVTASLTLPDQLRDDIAVAFSKKAGLVVEDKIFNVAVHYRQSPQKASMIEKILTAIVKPYGDKVRIVHGRKVFEVSLAMNNKGSAIERLLKTTPFKGRRPVFLGDDTTDLAAIGACLKNGGVAARVGRGDPRQKSAFDSPAKVRGWIKRLVEKS